MYSKNHNDIEYRAVQLLTMSDRIQHGYEVIEPALRAGKTVICDRYIYTSLANMLARGYTKERWFFKVARNLMRPDIVFLAYVPPETAIQRIKSRPEESNRLLDEELLKKVSENFLHMAKREDFHIINTSNKAEFSFKKVKDLLKRRGLYAREKLGFYH